MNTPRPLSCAPRPRGAAPPAPAVAGTHLRPVTAGDRVRERSQEMLVKGTINRIGIARRGWSP